MGNSWDHENSVAMSGLQEGNLVPLITLLEDSNRPLHPELRLWIAAMLRSDRQVKFWLQIKQHPGYPQSDPWQLVGRNVKIGLRIHELYDKGSRITDAKGEVVNEFELEERTIDEAWAGYRRLYFRLLRDNVNFVPHLKRLPPQKQKRS